MKTEEMITAIQGKLGVTVDGKAGPETWEAIYRKILKPDPATVSVLTSVEPIDTRSEKVISTLAPTVQKLARALVQKSAENGIRIKIISGLRTYEEQDALYAQGRTAPGNIVTKAKGGYSNHNFGIAFDVGVFEGSNYLTDSPKYKAVGVLGTELGLEWGGNWKTITDQPHFQLRPTWATEMNEKQMLAELRNRVSTGVPV